MLPFKVQLFLFFLTTISCNASNVKKPTGEPKSEWHWAAYMGNNRQLEQWLKEGKYQVDEIYIQNKTPSKTVAACPHCKYNLNPDNRTTALHWAVKANLLKTVKLLLNHGADVNKRRSDGWTALHYAANLDYEELLEVLFENGAEVDPQMYETMATPLNFAANKGYTKIVKRLLEKGANVSNPKMPDHKMPIHDASHHGFLDVIKILVQFGADPNIYSDEGINSFHTAVIKGHTDIIKYFVDELHVNYKAVRNDYATALHDAAANGYDDVVELLLSFIRRDIKQSNYEPNVMEESLQFIDLQTTDGVSSLYASIVGDRVNVTKLLLDFGANYKIQTEYGRPIEAADLAKELNHKDIFNVITRLQHTDMKTWSIDDVSYWLSNLEINSKGTLPRGVHWVLSENKLDGKKLSSLKKPEMLIKYGVTDYDMQEYIIYHIYSFNKSIMDKALDFLRNFIAYVKAFLLGVDPSTFTTEEHDGHTHYHE